MTIARTERGKDNVWPWRWPWKVQDVKTEFCVILTNSGLYILSLTSHKNTTYLGNFALLDFLSGYIAPANRFLFVPHGGSPTRCPMPSSGPCFSMKLFPLPYQKLPDTKPVSPSPATSTHLSSFEVLRSGGSPMPTIPEHLASTRWRYLHPSGSGSLFSLQICFFPSEDALAPLYLHQ